MQKYVYSTASILVLVVITGLGLAALRIGSFALMKGFYAATVVGLLGALVAGRFRRRGVAAFWFGFAAFAWGYFLLALAPWVGFEDRIVAGSLAQSLGPPENPLLPTNGVVEWVADTLAKPSKPPPMSGNAFLAGRPAHWRHAERQANTVVIGHLLLAWAFGVIGGLIALALSRPPRQKRNAGETGRGSTVGEQNNS